MLYEVITHIPDNYRRKQEQRKSYSQICMGPNKPLPAPPVKQHKENNRRAEQNKGILREHPQAEADAYTNPASYNFV